MNRKLYKSAILEFGGENSEDGYQAGGPLKRPACAFFHIELGIDIVGVEALSAALSASRWVLPNPAGVTGSINSPITP
jgi:hypothetical protein